MWPPIFFLNTGLFICFVYSRLSNFSAITDDWAANLGLCSALRAFEQGRIFIVPTPTATRDLSLYGLIRKTGTHVPQWGSNPQLKDHQIFEPDALSTAPHGRLDVLCTTTIDVVLATSTSILSIEMGFIEQLHYIITVVIHFTAGQEKIAEMVERL